MATGYSMSAIKTWMKTKETLVGFKGSKTRKKNTGDSGKAPIIPGQDALAIYLRDLRRQELAVTASHMFEFLREHHMDWVQNYMATRAIGYKSLLRLLAYYEENSRRLERYPSVIWEFHAKYGDTALDCIYNAYETGIYYDMCPKTIWAVRGGGSYVANTETHSYRMTALLTVRADGKKLPILFVIRGADGGTIETKKFDDYPQGHNYAMQEKAWMNGVVWKKFLRDVLKPSVENSSVLLVDNFDSHVSEESEKIIGEELGCELCPLPANATSFCQPLDVSLMGPFKQHLRD
ncbi:Aste57867_25467 [Aphanomyces stellatus]|uniref:Aste57867_25467 protein n=1 Tax=Aphanomyces stellatus TaxID=120398 RepID=A0A485LUJ8_9STRA|nr:hypothetical protein As57867_025388 [Aphanomyces stellatus]VFU02090.1 Aste57867_25467 [Aphanomyces stellatus]